LGKKQQKSMEILEAQNKKRFSAHNEGKGGE